jgi:hypothetical protein
MEGPHDVPQLKSRPPLASGTSVSSRLSAAATVAHTDAKIEQRALEGRHCVLSVHKLVLVEAVMLPASLGSGNASQIRIKFITRHRLTRM